MTTSRYIASVPEYHQKAVEAMEENLSALLNSPVEAPPENKTDAEMARQWPALKVVQ